MKANLPVLALAAALLAGGCGEEIVVRTDTRAFPDGGVHRRVEIFGRGPKGEPAAGARWLEDEAGVLLAAPDFWKRLESAPGRLSVEAYASSAADLPPTLGHRGEEGLLRDRHRTELVAQDLVVLRRRVYTETIGDPFGPARFERALDGLADLAARALLEEIRREFGEDLDAAGAERFVRGGARDLAAALLRVPRGRAAPGGEEQTRRRWEEILLRHGIPPAPDGEEKFWPRNIGPLLDWSRGRIAAALSTGERTIHPQDLSFWPDGEEPGAPEAALREIAGRVWGGEEELTRIAEPLLEALSGYYAGEGAPRFRFESRLVLPGRLLRTNGTVEGDAIVFFFRGEDLAAGDVTLEAESVEPDEERLVSLGARRRFDAARLLALTDLLARRDTEGLLAQRLRLAVERGRLEPLRSEKGLPDALAPLARELADLLDPDSAFPPPR